MSGGHTRSSWADHARSRAAQPARWLRLVFGRPPARRPRSSASWVLLLTNVAVVVALIVAVPEAPLGLWLSCATAVLVVNVGAFWRTLRDERLSAAMGLCAAVTVLAVVFPTSSVPEKYRSLVATARLIVAAVAFVFGSVLEVVVIAVARLKRHEGAGTAGEPPSTA